MKQHMITAVRLTLTCLVFFSGFYTLLVLGLAQFTTHKGMGAVVFDEGKKYYVNIGQEFTSDRYFNSRPSAVAYNAAAAGGSNKGPSNPEYLKQVEARIDTFLVHNPGISRAEIPADLVTASGSGLDPHISVQAAIIQIRRIAGLRGIAEGNLQQLILSNTEDPLFGLFGTEKVNVLKLNLALDDLK